MRYVLWATLVVSSASASLKAQRSEPAGLITAAQKSVHADSTYGAGTLAWTRPVVRSVRDDHAMPGDASPQEHHEVRNGALIVGAFGLTAGVVVGGLITSNCGDCSGFVGHARIMGAYGALGAAFGATAGAIAGFVVATIRQ